MKLLLIKIAVYVTILTVLGLIFVFPNEAGNVFIVLLIGGIALLLLYGLTFELWKMINEFFEPFE